MGKFKKCMYTIVLIMTCFVASPVIYKKIWENSRVKAHVDEYRELSDDDRTEIVTTDKPDPVTTENTSDNIDDVQPVTEAATEEQPQETQDDPIVFEKNDLSYFDDALFIGDSRTVGLSEYGSLKNADYFCSVGLMACHALTEKVGGITMEQSVSAKNYGKIYIMLGINEVGNDIEFTISHYREMLEKIRSLRPDAVIYLSANLHVTAASQSDTITNAGINTLNSRISQLADEYDKTFYIDENSLFDDANGNLNSDYTSDGIHVYAKYYVTWCDWLCENTVSVAVEPSAETDTADTTEPTSAAEPTETSVTTEPEKQTEPTEAASQ